MKLLQIIKKNPQMQYTFKNAFYSNCDKNCKKMFEKYVSFRTFQALEHKNLPQLPPLCVKLKIAAP